MRKAWALATRYRMRQGLVTVTPIVIGLLLSGYSSFEVIYIVSCTYIPYLSITSVGTSGGKMSCHCMKLFRANPRPWEPFSTSHKLQVSYKETDRAINLLLV